MSSTNGKGETVAIVDAYNDPNAQNDLNVYRSQFGLGSCTTTTGCFTQVNESGGTTLPRSSSSWSEEISLDLDMVSAICPNCKILLVEASSASITDLGTAVKYAASNANVVSNSYGAAEFSGETTYDSYYKHQGVPITVSAGDNGYGVEYPAASPYVTAVGGTTLVKDSSTRGWSESVWSGSGSGCSAYEPNPGWQPTNQCAKGRTVADTAAVADPNTGVAVYDSFHEPGWMVFGGTSVASPIIASIYALAGVTSSSSIVNASSLYGKTLGLNPVSTGSNGSCGNYLCNAADSISFTDASGSYNGPTGVGTPNGITGF
ncbi:MAG: S53 family peptidase [Acidimicrobiales bacterium]